MQINYLFSFLIMHLAIMAGIKCIKNPENPENTENPRNPENTEHK
jgi:hypothetical protein